MTMPIGGYPPRIYQFTPGDLSGLSVEGLGNGQDAFVASNRFAYILQDAVGVADGSKILDTLDDVTRQWVEINLAAPTSFPGYGLTAQMNAVGAANDAGTNPLVARIDHTHLGVQTVAAANANGGIGISTPDGANWTFQYVPLSVATPAALAAIPAAALFTGMPALVAAIRVDGGPCQYTLQPAVSTAPDSVFVIAASGDASRQWVHNAIQDQGTLVLYSPEIDLTAIQTVTLLPPLNYKYGQLFSAQQIGFFVVTAKDGTITTGPTAQMGLDAGISNLMASSVQAITATALNSQGAMTGVASPFNLDMSAHALRLQITSGAVLGTATVFKARIKIPLNFLK